MSPLILYRRLLAAFGEQGWWPATTPRGLVPRYDPSFKRRARTPRERLEIALGALLTQNTAWANAAAALGELKRAGRLAPAKLAALPPARLAALIRSSGYHNQKARKILAYLPRHGERDRGRLLAIWGVGPETADSILLYAHGAPVFVVDAYTRRILARLGLAAPGAGYAELQEWFQRRLPADAALFNEFHALLVRLAKEHCLARQPRCAGCPLSRRCRLARAGGRLRARGGVRQGASAKGGISPVAGVPRRSGIVRRGGSDSR